MAIYKVPHENGYYRMMIMSDVEYVNPIDYYSSQYIEYRSSFERDILLLKKLNISAIEIENFVIKRAQDEWEKEYLRIKQIELPQNLIYLLKSESKKDQIKLLKDQYITPSILLGLIFISWTDFGYTFSQYSAHHHHKGIDKSQIPKLIELRDDKVIKIGNTNLTDGQLKNVVEQRKVIVAKFIDNDHNWHCFFATFKSLNRKESWKGGQPHFHYISSKFGLSRKEVLANLKNENYSLGNLPHIEIKEYHED
jgi:hypothetical protein